jgi:hypothetical protein
MFTTPYRKDFMMFTTPSNKESKCNYMGSTMTAIYVIYYTEAAGLVARTKYMYNIF